MTMFPTPEQELQTIKDWREMERVRAEAAEARVAELTIGLNIALDTLKRVTIFVNSKERIKQPEGKEWFDDGILSARQALAGQPDPVREAEPLISKEIHWQRGDGRHPDRVLQEAERAVVEAAMLHRKTRRWPLPELCQPFEAAFIEACDDLAKLREEG